MVCLWLEFSPNFSNVFLGEKARLKQLLPVVFGNPLTNPKVYAADVPKHDAFSSGHITTMMTTVSVLAMNYPNKKYIRPVGYSLMGIVGFQMMNNGVHWFTDYPLAVAMGYGIAKVVTSRGRTEKTIDLSGNNININNIKNYWNISPTYLPSANLGMSVAYNF